MERQLIVVVICCLVSTVADDSLGGDVDAKSRLFTTLIGQYRAAQSSEVEPPQPDGGNTTVKILLGLKCAAHSHDLVVLETWTYGIWKDSRLAWDPNEYDGVDALRVPAYYIWLPDTRLYSQVKADLDWTPAILRSDGSVVWVPIVNYYTRCAEPDGIHIECDLRIGSWTYDASIIDVDFVADDSQLISTADYSEGCPWVVESHVDSRDEMTYGGKQYVTLRSNVLLTWRQSK